MLFYELEKQLYFPPLFIPCSYQVSIFIEHIGYKAYCFITAIYGCLYNTIMVFGILLFTINKFARLIANDRYCATRRLCSNILYYCCFTFYRQFGTGYKPFATVSKSIKRMTGLYASVEDN